MSFPRFCVLFVALGLLGAGCDFADKQFERTQLLGQYAIAGDSNFTAFWPASESVIDLNEAGATLTLNISSSDNSNKGAISGSIIIPDSLFATPDSTQLLFRDSVDVQFEGDYVFVIDRLNIRLKEDTSGSRTEAPIPLAWDYDEGRLTGSTRRYINSRGEEVPSEDAVGAVSISVALQKQ